MLVWRPSAGPALRCLKTRCIRLNSTDVASSSVPDLNARVLDKIGVRGKRRIAEDLDGVKIPPRAETKIYSTYSLAKRLINLTHVEKPALPSPPPADAAPSDEPSSSVSSSPSEPSSSSAQNDAPAIHASHPGEQFQKYHNSVDLDNVTGVPIAPVRIPTPKKTARIRTAKQLVANVDLDGMLKEPQSSAYSRDNAPRQPKTDVRDQGKDGKQPFQANVRPVRTQRGNAPPRRSQSSTNTENARPRQPRIRRNQNQNSSAKIVLTGDAVIDAHVQAVLDSEEKTIPEREPNVSYSYLPHSRGPATDFALPQAEVPFNERRGPGMEDEAKNAPAHPQVLVGSLFSPSRRRYKGNYKQRLPDDRVWATPVTQLPTAAHAQMVSGRQSSFHLWGQKEVLKVVKSLQETDE